MTYENLVFNQVMGDGMTDSGSAVSLTNGSMQMLGCTIVNCAAADGGAIAIVGNQASAFISGTRFSGEIGGLGGGRHGGAIYSESPKLVVDGCAFDGLEAMLGFGGAIYSGCSRQGCDPKGISLVVINSNFTNLQAQQWGDNTYGGAIYSTGTSLQVVSSYFFNCTADSVPSFYPVIRPSDGLGYGGGIFAGSSPWLGYGELIVTDSTFVECRARWNKTTPCGGGAIASVKKNMTTLRNNTFTHNVGGDIGSWYQHAGGDTCNVSMFTK